MSEMEAMAFAFTELYVRSYAATALDGMLQAIEEWRPHVVVRESSEFSSLVAAERTRIPHVEVGVGLSMQVDRLLPLAAPALDELGRTVGLAPGLAERLSASLCLTMAPASLEDPGAPARANVLRFRGTSQPAAGSLSLDWGDPGAPLVYMSFGTEVPSPTRNYFPGLYRGAIDALAQLPVRVLVTIGKKRDPAELGPLPASVRVERWIAQAEVMPHAAAMVGHGGAGTTLTALAAGVPTAFIALFADQPLNARRVAALHAGIALDGGADSTPQLASAVQTLLTDPSYRRRAIQLADEIRALPPVDDAAEVLSAIAAERRSAAVA
jgi:UDP:flavonoid glycosyltransferase YjiC (YdhE family)